MSKQSTQKITCPKCGLEQEAKIWDSINVTLNPEVKQKILDGSFFQFRCSKCGYTAPLAYPCLYHDMEQGLLIWLLPGNANKGRNMDQINSIVSGMGIDFTSTEKPYSYRVVEDSNALREKVLISDEGLDDRMIEVMKVIYLAQIQNQTGGEKDLDLYLDGSKGKYQFLVFFPDGRTAAVPLNMDFYRDLYEVQKEMLEECTPSTFCAVDRDWANAIMEGIQEASED